MLGPGRACKIWARAFAGLAWPGLAWFTGLGPGLRAQPNIQARMGSSFGFI
jgi:hypothetical protein